MISLIRALLATFAAILVLSCNKSSSETSEITGKWILSEYYMDPGDGSGKWQNASTTNTEWLDFKTNNQLESGNSSMFPTYTEYQMLSDSTLLFKSGQGSTMQVRYQLTPDLLTIRPSCIEGCGFKYKRPGR